MVGGSDSTKSESVLAGLGALMGGAEQGGTRPEAEPPGHEAGPEEGSTDFLEKCERKANGLDV